MALVVVSEVGCSTPGSNAPRSRAVHGEGLYARLLGASWSSLAPAIRRLSESSSLVHRGAFDVTRGEGPLARVLGWLSRLPAAGRAVPVTLIVREAGSALIWARTFAGRPLATSQRIRGECLGETLGLIECFFDLRTRDGGLEFVQRGATLRLGPLAIPLPRFLSPRVHGLMKPASESAASVAVSIGAPLVGLLVDYRGEIEIGTDR